MGPIFIEDLQRCSHFLICFIRKSVHYDVTTFPIGNATIFQFIRTRSYVIASSQYFKESKSWFINISLTMSTGEPGHGHKCEAVLKHENLKIQISHSERMNSQINPCSITQSSSLIFLIVYDMVVSLR